MGLYTGLTLQPDSTIYYSTELPFYAPFYGVYELGSSEKSIAASVFSEWDQNLSIDFAFTSDYSSADIVLCEAFIDGYGGTLGLYSPTDPDGDGLVSGGADEGYAFIYMDYYDTSLFTATLRHEIGHALGLDHDETPGSVMNSLLWGDETVTDYDIAKAAAIYGYERNGSAGSDDLTGSQVGDRFSTAAGNDLVRAGLGDDTVFAGADADTLMGESGSDILYGEAGEDIIYGNTEIDALFGGTGDDTLYGGQNSGSARADAYGNLRQQDGVETIDGGAGDDVIYGNYGNDSISGGIGNDAIFAGQNDDTVDGGAGDDFIAGNRGNDVLTGGSGADTFFFGAQDQGADAVTDFSAGEGDRLSFAGSYSTAASGSDLLITHGGGTVTLSGVSSTGLDAGWIA